jgi:electron transfer flavoprotein beta subunit
MGPKKAEEAIREAIAMGCDDGVLLSGNAFAGSDTWATSYALSKAIRAMGDFDLILCGERATDGDTGQVGPGIAAWLDVPVGTYISEIMEVLSGAIRVKRLVEDGYETLEIETPCVVTVVKEIAYPRLPTLRGKQRSRKIDIPVWGPEQIDADIGSLGLQGSPTRVVKIDTPKINRLGEIRSPKGGMDYR